MDDWKAALVADGEQPKGEEEADGSEKRPRFSDSSAPASSTSELETVAAPEPVAEDQGQNPELGTADLRKLLSSTEDAKMLALASLVEQVMMSNKRIPSKKVVQGTQLAYSLCFTKPSAFAKVYELAQAIEMRSPTSLQRKALRGIFSKLKKQIRRENLASLFQNPLDSE